MLEASALNYPLAEQQVLIFATHTSLNIISDPKLLRRIVQNFLTNAFHYANGSVLLGVRNQGEQVRIDVWDRGQGIPQDKLQFIFEEFKRLDSHQTREEKGLGLGLAIADGLSKVLNHQIEVRSWLGKGSVFSITVPLYRGVLNKIIEPAHKDHSATQPLAGLRVLCVDNESSILAGMHSLLSRWGCDVLTASNREECLALIENGIHPDLALVDFHLDGGDTGIALMAWLRQQVNAPIPGIVISADGRPELVSQVHAAGLSFLAKPVKPAALRALINRHIPN